MELDHLRAKICSKYQYNCSAGSAYFTSLIGVGEGSKVGWVDVSLSEG